jgi:diguanylate cyclase (GGDEF)-like protein/PAS domain S-box-containing protein
VIISDRWNAIGMIRDISERKRAETLLHDSEERLRGIFDGAQDGILLAEIETLRISTSNSAMCRMLGYSAEELGQLSIRDIHREQDWPYVFEQFKKQASGETRVAANLPIKRKDGSVFFADITTSPVNFGDKHYLVGIFRDITERKQAEANIKYLNRVLSVLSGINTLIVHVNDREALFRGACNIAVEAGGFRMAMLVIVDQSTILPISIMSAGKDEKLLADIKNLMSTRDGMQTTLVAQAMREKKAVIANDTQNHPRLLFGKQYAEAGVNSVMVLPLIISGEAVGALALYASEIEFFQEDEMKLLDELAGDIAFAIDHIEKQERLNYLAYYDVLTGLANRSLFLDRLTQYIHSAISGRHTLAIGMIDLERFRNINDSLGRPAGDLLLKQVAAWLTQFAQDANLLARIDADHFAFVVPEIKTDGNLAILIENLMAAFQEHAFDLSDATFRIGIKVGIAVFPDDGDNADTLYMNAEAALKKTKLSGDRYLFYTQTMTEAVAEKLTLENQLRRAIDNEEFVLYYQPKVNLMSGKVIGAEALIRWNDPRTGLVPPGKFIPILEETGLIFEVGRWALRQAVSDWLRWRNSGLPAVRIAVNVSPLQLHSLNFIDEIKEILSIDADAAAGVELEITESLIMQDIRFSTTRLEAVRALGITIAIDDFGTGFSSLNYLSKLPVDTLKIDRSFIIEMDTPAGLTLVTTIIVMAHALKLKVVAEGVETEQQMRQLQSLNCDEMQGFLFSKPVPADIFEARFLAPLTPSDS